MKDIQQAIRELREYLGYPSWLSAIGHSVKGGKPQIVVYLTGVWRPSMPFLTNGWEGYPVIVRENASFAPLGGDKE